MIQLLLNSFGDGIQVMVIQKQSLRHGENPIKSPAQAFVRPGELPNQSSFWLVQACFSLQVPLLEEGHRS